MVHRRNTEADRKNQPAAASTVAAKEEEETVTVSTGINSESEQEIPQSDAEKINESLESSILRLKLIRGFQNSDTSELQDVIEKNSSVIQYRTLLHLAVQIGSVQMIEWLIEKYSDQGVHINGIDKDGHTPLHLAASYGRTDVATYLLSLPEINDTIRDKDGKQPVEVSKYPETAEAMQLYRAKYVEKIASQMKEYLTEENTIELEELLSNPRAAALLDINGQDPDTGSTVLHDFVKKKNAKMVEFILCHGGDPFHRDMKGVLPIELTKDEKIKKLLKDATKEQPVINPPSQVTGNASNGTHNVAGAGNAAASNTGQPLSSQTPPAISGYLKKWTNFTGGYKLRWFVLENGVLSYYKRQDDTDRACRGSINMKKAGVHLDSSEKTRFEINMDGSSTKFHLKANHKVETNRWVWALTNAIQYSKDQEKLRKQQAHHQSSLSDGGDGSVQLERTNTRQSQSSARSSSMRQQLSSVANGENSSRFINQSQTASGNKRNPSGGQQSVDPTLAANFIENDMDRKDDEDRAFAEDDDVSEISGEDNAPFESQQGVLEDTINVELSAMSDLIQSLTAGEASGALSADRLSGGLSIFQQSLETLKSAAVQYTKQSNLRERFYQRKLEQSEAQQRLWAQNIRELELDHERIQGELHKAIQKKKETSKLLQQQKGNSGNSGAAAAATGGVAAATAATASSTRSKSEESCAGVSVDDDDSDDEFFDVEEAMETDTKSVAESPESAENYEDSSKMTSTQASKNESIVNESSFAGYEDPPRERLKMEVDDRPKISLWGILKNLIGKDMTKMTLPVSFNECTNLLQRSAEDMEYTDILDKACKYPDDGSLRAAYVTAFAASSYSSTINRIAKPFNPILGETYEYARPDKGYRLFAEQVSHHPPIGAVIAESPRWDFYGESNVKSKFNGRSFDINPLGRWYVVLRPDSSGEEGSAPSEELYSFRKLTSSVVGIITGSPVVDNYGDMEVINHTTGHKCIAKFKSRGWRGANAYEVKGTCYSPDGEAEWAIAGKWDDKIYAKKIVKESTTPQGQEEQEDAETTANTRSSDSKKILLWQVHDRPPAPFNLTPFAITLNAFPDKLKPWLPPTDSRLRPDQRAMEEGRYDDASEDKHRVEEKQRAARRKRESEQKEYSPVWFNLTKHPVTGDNYYKPTGDYWSKRKAHELKEYSEDIF